MIVVLLCLTLAGCGGFGFGRGAEGTVPAAPRERSVDPARAVALINEHRTERGREPLTVDRRLSAIARQTARELARRDTLRTEMHTRDGLSQRLEAAGYPARRAAENLGAGYPTLTVAIEAWKASRRHNRNLLNRDLTHAGIGLGLTDEGVFRSYWVLVLATPEPDAETVAAGSRP